jgi:uncharacterized membrane protein YgcG
VERIAEWVIALFTSTHALVIGLLTAIAAAWRAVRRVLVAAALSSVREETIAELRREIDHLRNEVEYHRSHSRVGGGGSGSTGTSSASGGNGATTST